MLPVDEDVQSDHFYDEYMAMIDEVEAEEKVKKASAANASTLAIENLPARGSISARGDNRGRGGICPYQSHDDFDSTNISGTRGILTRGSMESRGNFRGSRGLGIFCGALTDDTGARDGGLGRFGVFPYQSNDDVEATNISVTRGIPTRGSMDNRGNFRGSRLGTFGSAMIDDPPGSGENYGARGNRGVRGRGFFERSRGRGSIEGWRGNGDRGIGSGGASTGSLGHDTKCRYCGENGHFVRECQKKKDNTECLHCKKRGHIKRECLQKSLGIRDVQDIFSEDAAYAKEYAAIVGQDLDVFKTDGDGDLDPIVNWADSPFEEVIKNNIHAANYEFPRNIQAFAMPYIINGRDVLVHAETGSGKTAAYMIPVIDYVLKQRVKSGKGYKPIDKLDTSFSTPSALILVPTKELARQVCEQGYKFARDTNVAVRLLLGHPELNQLYKLMMENCDILVGTPGIIKNLVQKGEVMVKYLRFFILDEADRMLTDKRSNDDFSFVNCIQTIRNIHGFPRENVITLLVSATFSDEIQAFANENLFKENRVFVTNKKWVSANKRVKHVIIPVNTQNKLEMAFDIIKLDLQKQGQKYNSPILVFVNSRQVSLFSSFLTNNGIPSIDITGILDIYKRNQAMKGFQAGQYKVLVANDLCARGIDFKKVDHVINIDVPTFKSNQPDYQRTTFIHRIGRTGRTRIGFATTLFDALNDEHKKFAPTLAKILRDVEQPVPEYFQSINNINAKEWEAIISANRNKRMPQLESQFTTKEAQTVSIENKDAVRSSLHSRKPKVEILHEATLKETSEKSSAMTQESHEGTKSEYQSEYFRADAGTVNTRGAFARGSIGARGGRGIQSYQGPW